MSNGVDAYCNKSENITIIGNFTVDVKEVSLHLLCNQYKLKSLNKDPTCYKNIGNSSCIDLLLTNSAKSFESTVKPLHSGHLRVLKNLSVIKRCPLLGGSLTKIVTFGTKHFVRYLRHVYYLGCPLLGGFTYVYYRNRSLRFL